MQNLDFVMIGNRAVGKTSLLSAMWHELDTSGLSTIGGVELCPGGDGEFDLLKRKWIELGKYVQGKHFGTIVPNYVGSMEAVEHPFDLNIPGHGDFTLNFVDTPGGWSDNLSPELLARVKNAFGVFCVIDAAVLMEMDNICNDETNIPGTVKRIFEKMLKDGDPERHPNCCYFIPVKCEKYMKSEDTRNRLFQKFLERFGFVDAYLTEKGIQTYYMPVQTMGCVEYSYTDPESHELKFRIVNGGNFKPVDAAAVLPLILWRVLCMMDIWEKEKPWWKKFPDLFTWFRRNKQPIEQFMNAVKNGAPKPLDLRVHEYGEWHRWGWYLGEV